MMVSQDFEHSALVPLATLGQPVCQELYRDVAMIRAWASRKNGRSLGMRLGRKDEYGG